MSELTKINYDRYKGHSPGPWGFPVHPTRDGKDADLLALASFLDKFFYSLYENNDPAFAANSYLVFDARRLLQACRERDDEIVRLREELLDIFEKSDGQFGRVC